MNQTLSRWLLFLIPLAYMMITPWSLSEGALWAGYGKHLLADFGFLYHDNASLLPSDNNVTSAWAVSILYFGLYKIGGYFALAHFHHLILLVLLALLYRSTIFRNPWPWTLKERLPIYLIWLGAGAAFSIRPALLAFLPFFFSYQLLEERISQNKFLSLADWKKLILLQLLWVNLHASFVILPLMVGWVILFQFSRWRQNILGLATLMIATLANPFGFKIYPYILRTREYSQLLGISEWVPATSLDFPLQLLLYWGFFLGMAALVGRDILNDKRNLFTSPLVPLTLLPLTGLRLSVFAFMVLPLFLRLRMGFYSAGSPRTHLKPAGVVPAFLLILGVTIAFSPYFKPHFSHLLPNSLKSSFDDSSIIAISEKIKDWPERNCPILNDFNVGHFLLLSSSNTYLLDGRITPFTMSGLELYKSLMSVENIDFWIKKEKPCLAILSLSHSGPLILELKRNYGFTPLLAENDYLLLGVSGHLGNNDVHNK